MNRQIHVSEPKWGDDPDEERFETRQAYDWATLGILCVVLLLVAAFLSVWWWLLSTVQPGVPLKDVGVIEEARR